MSGPDDTPVCHAHPYPLHAYADECPPPADITEQPITVANWYQHVNWLNTTFIIFIPLIGLVSSYWIELQYKTAIFAVSYYFFAGLGISRSLSMQG